METTIEIDRKKTLKKVRAILAATSSPWPLFATNPRVYRGFLLSAPVLLVSMILSALGVGLVVAMVVFAVAWKMTPAETWEERFLRLMADYQPLNEASYQELLSKIKDGTTDRDAITAWLRAESIYVEHHGQVAAERALLEARLK